MKEVSATLRNARISAQKCRLVTRYIQGMPVGQAVNYLLHSPKKASQLILKVLNSSIANAEENDGLDIDELKIRSAYVNEGATLKRMRARAKGRGSRILKRTCHITVKVSE